ncbi:MAG: hypothetical protein ACOCRK_04955 [bacterium]
MLPPKKRFSEFSTAEEKFHFLKKCGVLKKDRKLIKKDFLYKGLYTQKAINCEIVGYIDINEIVIKFKDGRLHCIHPHYLKDMQKSSFVVNSYS